MAALLRYVLSELAFYAPWQLTLYSFVESIGIIDYLPCDLRLSRFAGSIMHYAKLFSPFTGRVRKSSHSSPVCIREYFQFVCVLALFAAVRARNSPRINEARERKRLTKAEKKQGPIGNYIECLMLNNTSRRLK